MDETTILLVAPPTVIGDIVIDRKFIRFQIDSCHAFIGIIIEKYKKGDLASLGKEKTTILLLFAWHTTSPILLLLFLDTYLTLAHKCLFTLGNLANMERLSPGPERNIDLEHTYKTLNSTIREINSKLTLENIDQTQVKKQQQKKQERLKKEQAKLKEAKAKVTAKAKNGPVFQCKNCHRMFTSKHGLAYHTKQKVCEKHLLK